MNAAQDLSALDAGADHGVAGDSGFAILVGALSVAAACALVLACIELDALSSQMAAHIASMNVAAPLAAVALGRRYRRYAPRATIAGLWLATVGQLTLLWASHSPAFHHAAYSNPLVLAGLHLALFLAALLFWIYVADAGSSRWQAMLALLVSGKFACLLGALLIFAPRLLFDAPATGHAGHPATLADQHLAGLLMIAACPLSYVLTAIVLAAQALTALERAHAPAVPNAPATGR